MPSDAPIVLELARTSTARIEDIRQAWELAKRKFRLDDYDAEMFTRAAVRVARAYRISVPAVLAHLKDCEPQEDRR